MLIDAAIKMRLIPVLTGNSMSGAKFALPIPVNPRTYGEQEQIKEIALANGG